MEVDRKPNFRRSPPPIGDMILRQPENIVHEILSHLDLSDLVRTSVLSKPWRYLWITSTPNLIFDTKIFGLNGCKDVYPSRAEGETRLLFVEQTLGIRSRSCISLENLVLNHVQITSQATFACLDNCIRYAIASDFKRFKLRIEPRIGLFYTLPPTLFGHRGLVELHLSGCLLKSSSFPSNYTSLSCLKLLHLDGVTVDSMKLIEDLIASCPLIQDLILSICLAYTRVLKLNTINRVLKIANNPMLINLKVEQCTFERIEIDAPGLKSLRFTQDMSRNRVNAPCDIVMTSCKNITSLKLNNIYNMSTSINNILSRLLQLESIVLHNCTTETIKISTSILKKLMLVWCKKLVKVEVDNPNLCWFFYTGENMIYFASNASDLKVLMGLYTNPSHVPSTIWFIEFVEFLARFNTAKTLTLMVQSDKNLIVPRELRASLLPPLYNVEHLVLCIKTDSYPQTIHEFIEGVLWLSPHPVNVYFTLSGINVLELTFLYDEIDAEGKYCDCFPSLIRCWRHCIKEVKIKKLRMDQDDLEKSIKSFFEDAGSLRKFDDM